MSSYYNWKTDEFQRDRKYQRTRYKTGPQPASTAAVGSNSEQLQEIAENTTPQIFTTGKIFKSSPQAPLKAANCQAEDINSNTVQKVLEYSHPKGQIGDTVSYTVQLDQEITPNVNYRITSEISNIEPNINCTTRPLGQKEDETVQGFTITPENPNENASANILLRYIVQSAATELPAWVVKCDYRFTYEFFGQDEEVNNAGEPMDEEPDLIPEGIEPVNNTCPCPVQTPNQLAQNAINSKETNACFMDINFTSLNTTAENKVQRVLRACIKPSPYGKPRNKETGFSGEEQTFFETVGFNDFPQPPPDVEIVYDLPGDLYNNECYDIVITSEQGQDLGSITLGGGVKDPYRSEIPTFDCIQVFDCPPTDDPPSTTYIPDVFYVDVTDLRQPLTVDAADNQFPSSGFRFLQSPGGPYTWKKCIEIAQGIELTQGAFFSFKAPPLERGGQPYDGSVKWAVTSTQKPPGVDVKPFINPQLGGVNVYLTYDGVASIPAANAPGEIYIDVAVKCTLYAAPGTQTADNILKEIEIPYRICLLLGDNNSNAKDVILKSNPKLQDQTVQTNLIETVPVTDNKLIQNMNHLNNEVDPMSTGIWTGATFEGLVLKRGTGGSNLKNIVRIPYWKGNYSGASPANLGIRTNQDLAVVPQGNNVLSKTVKATGPLGNVNLQWLREQLNQGIYRTNFTGTQAQWDAICNPGFNLIELEFDLPARPAYTGLPITGVFTRLPPSSTEMIHRSASDIFDYSLNGQVPIWNYNTYGESMLVKGPQNLLSERFFFKVPLKGMIEETLSCIYAGGCTLGPDAATQNDFSPGETVGTNDRTERKLELNTHYKRDEFFAYFCIARRQGSQCLFSGIRYIQYKFP